jgi:ABC-type multidrug transport system ATPase subunit
VTWGLRDVTVLDGRRRVLDAVTMDVEAGDVTVVVGGDGAGKSTLLRVLLGLVEPTRGAVDRPDKGLVGYVTATGGSYDDLTVLENMTFAGSAYGISRDELGPRVTSLLARIGLDDARHRLGGHLSGGMRRKLALATALVHDPALLVLDEPTTGVDPVSRVELWRLISGAAARGAGVVVTTSYVEEARRGTSVVLLGRGRVLARGTPEEIVARVPGRVGVVAGDERPRGLAWRRGASWRVWARAGDLPEGAAPVDVTFNDAVMIASMGDA